MKNEVPRIFSKNIASDAVFHADSESELSLVRIYFQTWDIQHRTCKNDRFRHPTCLLRSFSLPHLRQSPHEIASFCRVFHGLQTGVSTNADHYILTWEHQRLSRQIDFFLWNIQELSETISEDKWVRNTGLQISSFLFCRTIRSSCRLILPNDTLKQFDHKKQSKLHCSLFEVHITLGSRSEVSAFIKSSIEGGSTLLKITRGERWKDRRLEELKEETSREVIMISRIPIIAPRQMWNVEIRRPPPKRVERLIIMQ